MLGLCQDHAREDIIRFEAGNWPGVAATDLKRCRDRPFLVIFYI